MVAGALVSQPLAGTVGPVEVSCGAVLSTLTATEALPVLPALSVHVAASVPMTSPLDMLLVAQLAVSMREPPLPSLQFQVTVTSLLLQPALLAAGFCVGL